MRQRRTGRFARTHSHTHIRIHAGQTNVLGGFCSESAGAGGGAARSRHASRAGAWTQVC
jgi:hypothetical protein